MKEFLKQNIALVLAFALPFILIFGVVISVYIPSLFVKTSYNFIYAFCDSQNYYNCDTTLSNLPKKYSVENGKLTIHDTSTLSTTTKAFDYNSNGMPGIQERLTRLFLHDTKTNTSREITKEEGLSLTLSGLLTSPDGASVAGRYTRNGGDFFLFGGSQAYNYYLMQGKSSARLNLIQSNGLYYQNNVEFIGWIIPGRNN